MFHTLGDLSNEGLATGVIYGFLSRVVSLGHKFNTNKFMFCWDSRYSFRREIEPNYKANRREKSPEEQERYSVLFEQIDTLKFHALPKIGFRNIFEQRGIEADDIIAALAWLCYTKDKESMVVSSDEDLFQCLEHGAEVYNPSSKKIWTYNSFREHYGILPSEWVDVKVIAGCSSDNVKGVEGVGEKTAIKWLKNELKETTKKYKDIHEMEDALYKANVPLVKIPIAMTTTPIIREDKLSLGGLMKIAEQFGMTSVLEEKTLDRWDDLFHGEFNCSEDFSGTKRQERKGVVKGIRERRKRRKRK